MRIKFDAPKLVSAGAFALLSIAFERLIFWVDVIAIGSAIAGLFTAGPMHVLSFKTADQIAAVRPASAIADDKALDEIRDNMTAAIPAGTNDTGKTNYVTGISVVVPAMGGVSLPSLPSGITGSGIITSCTSPSGVVTASSTSTAIVLTNSSNTATYCSLMTPP